MHNPEEYDVSVVLTVFNKWGLTKACLSSIFDSIGDSKLKVEIIISDNCSTDETPTAWQHYQDRKWPIRYHRNDENIGYLRNANAGSRLARGRYTCLLNNDILVEPGWLDKMVETMESSSDIGVVGPKYLSKGGLVLETGVVVRSDGTGQQLGNDTKLKDPLFSYVNDVHYCGLACGLIRTDLFRDLGYYDERFAPCYYEDTDLCMRVAEAGYRVIVDPSVKIIHFVGSSYGKPDNSSTAGKFIQINRHKFVAKWRNKLAKEHPSPFMNPARYRSWKRKDTIVFHWPGPMSPTYASGTLRAWRMLLEVRRWGWHVVLFCPSIEQRHKEALWRNGIEVHKVKEAKMDFVEDVINCHHISAVVFSFVHEEERYSHLYRRKFPQAIRIFDTVDLHFLREMRERISTGISSYNQKDIELSPENLPEIGLREISAYYAADVTLVVSDYEKDLLQESLGIDGEKVSIVTNIHEPEDQIQDYDRRDGFAFIGAFFYSPNVDSLNWIVSEIWPRIRIKLPEASLRVYGIKMPRVVRKLHNKALGIHVIGFVEDHRKAISDARILLSPMRFGAGVKGKIGESMAVGTVVVTTPVGAEGMDPEGKSLGIAEDSESLADLAVELHENEEEWNRRSRAAASILEKKFSSRKNIEVLMESIDKARLQRKVESPDAFIIKLLHAQRMQWQNIIEKIPTFNQNYPNRSLALDVLFPLENKIKGFLIKNNFLSYISRGLYDFLSLRFFRERRRWIHAVKSPFLRRTLILIVWTISFQLHRRLPEFIAQKWGNRLKEKTPAGTFPGAKEFCHEALIQHFDTINLSDYQNSHQAEDQMEIQKIFTHQDFDEAMANPIWKARVRLEKHLAFSHQFEEEFTLPGFSLLAGQPVDFKVDRLYGSYEEDGIIIPMWRERLVCPIVGLTNRQRAIIGFLMSTLNRLPKNPKPVVFCLEQVTPLFDYLQKNLSGINLIGCEWLGPDVQGGKVVNGVRHEDIHHLSLEDESVDILISLEVFEHIPDPKAGFREKMRILKPGGNLIMTVPFFTDHDVTVQRARQENGQVVHLLPPEYHSNPIDEDGGSLVFYDFGWDLLGMMEEAGFQDVHMKLYWSLELGHLGVPQMVFSASRK